MFDIDAPSDASPVSRGALPWFRRLSVRRPPVSHLPVCRLSACRFPIGRIPVRQAGSLAALIVTLLLPATAPAQSSGARPGYGAPGYALTPVDPLAHTIDDIVRPALASQAIPALTVAITQNGLRRYFTYIGGTGPRIERDTIVEIGSITKVFTTALAAEAVSAGQMSLDAPMQQYLPHLRLSECAARVTPLQLADFTSGMPTLPDNVPAALRNRGIDNYTERDFLQWIAGWNPGVDGRCVTPAHYAYSNASVGLLGHMVANATGTPWRELVAQRITIPLGMVDTGIDVPAQHRNRLAQGHGPLGAPVMPWPVFAWFAAGALRSTPQDMLRFGEAALGMPQVDGHRVPDSLTHAFRTAMSPIYQPDGKPFLQAMSWAVRPATTAPGSVPVTLKDGGTDGFNSVLVISPDTQVAVFVVANKAQSGVPGLGVAIARAIPAAARAALATQ